MRFNSPQESIAQSKLPGFDRNRRQCPGINLLTVRTDLLLAVAREYQPLHIEHDGSIRSKVVRHECGARHLLALELNQPVASAAIDPDPMILQVLAEQAQTIDIYVNRTDAIGRAGTLLVTAGKSEPLIQPDIFYISSYVQTARLGGGERLAAQRQRAPLEVP